MRPPPLRFLGILLALILSRTPPAAAQEGAPSRSGLYAVPFVIYSPETSWIFGIGASGFTRPSADTTLKPSTYSATLQYSVNGQYVFGPSAQLYFDEGKTLVEGRVRLLRSIEEYYGVGNEAPTLESPSYEMRRIQVRAEFLRRIGGSLYVGPLGEFSDEIVCDRRENPLLLGGLAPGQNASRAAGFGLSLMVDTRDRVYSPSQGSYSRVRCATYPEWFGSDAGFQWIEADFRHYLAIGEPLVLAGQLFVEGTGGDVPFFRLPLLGGEERMRGIFRGRFRDRVSLVIQTELRADLFWRIGAVLFASVGEVASGVRGVALNGFRHTAGLGLRYLVDDRERLKVRIDYGAGPGTDGFYMTVDEAF